MKKEQVSVHVDEHDHGCGCSHSCDSGAAPAWRKQLPVLVSFLLLAAAMIVDFVLGYGDSLGNMRLILYAVAYLPVGLPVMKEAFEAMAHKDYFNEFTLMVVATLGAFFVGEYPEAVAVMLFYSVGELFQASAVSKARRNIKSLLDIRPDTATVLKDGQPQTVSPESVAVGDTIQVKVGEKVPLDGLLLADSGSFNTSALTGESTPQTIRKGETVLAGMINLNGVINIEVKKIYADSSFSRILEMVQDATARKAKTELLIRRFARIYTPIVFLLALAVTVVPALFVTNYVFNDWLYRALVFLVISCPCALVISVPLSYFCGIGTASRAGILFKGANYLDVMARVNTVVMDKTGTLTQGVFKVQKVVAVSTDRERMLGYACALERYSTHPVAKAVVEYCADLNLAALRDEQAEQVEEIAGHGLKGVVRGVEVLAGNGKLMKRYGCVYDEAVDSLNQTIVLVALDRKYAGYITIADKLKEDAPLAIRSMRKLGIRKTVMLSGDKLAIVQEVAATLMIDEAHGDLLPEDKVAYMEHLKTDTTNVVAFVGDGINDAPVLALSDLGIAMGGMGSEAAVDVADVVIQTDQPSKLAVAVKVARKTRQIVVQNIVLALGVKLLVLVLGVLGVATMWEAVFADVGVSLLAILNAVRIYSSSADVSSRRLDR